MDFNELLHTAPLIQTNGTIIIPPTYRGDTNFIVPDPIVHYCIDHYNLLRKEARILDPLCGIGTIPRIIQERGGNCIGIEMNSMRYHAALELVDNKILLYGNYLELTLPEQHFQCIFTSMPFDWFMQDPPSVKADFAEKSHRLLLPNFGFILLDTIEIVQKDGEEWSVAQKQSEYLESYGFELTEIVKFKNGDQEKNTNESMIMKLEINNKRKR